MPAESGKWIDLPRLMSFLEVEKLLAPEYLRRGDHVHANGQELVFSGGYIGGGMDSPELGKHVYLSAGTNTEELIKINDGESVIGGVLLQPGWAIQLYLIAGGYLQLLRIRGSDCFLIKHSDTGNLSLIEEFHIDGMV